MGDQGQKHINEQAREVWEDNAAFWDERMGEGNDFVEVLIWPTAKRMLELQPGQHVLEIACGNGLYARRMAALGVQVLAFDFSQALIARAMARTIQQREWIEYRVLDATDEGALLALGERRFDAALCSMGLFDMAEIDPLMRAMARLLRPEGRFVFSVMHPCFNNPAAVHVGEMEDHGGQIITTYSIKVRDYIHPTVARAAAIRGQPRAQPVFHRPLQALFGAAFAAGFVIDALEEPAFPPDHPEDRYALGWGPNYASIPPVLIARVRPRGQDGQ